MSTSSINTPFLLNEAFRIIEDVKQASKNSFDILLDPTFTSFCLEDFEIHYNRLGQAKFKEIGQYYAKLDAYRAACRRAHKQLSLEGKIKFQFPHAANHLAVIKFGMGECSELTSLVQTLSIKRNLLPCMLINIHQIKENGELTSKSHAFTILGLTYEKLELISPKHNGMIIPFLQELTDCVLIDPLLRVAQRVEDAVKTSSLFMQYIHHHKFTLMREYACIENQDVTIANQGEKEAQMIYDYVTQHGLFATHYQPSPVERFLEGKKIKDEAAIISILDSLANEIKWKKKGDPSETIYWCENSLSKLEPLRDNLTRNGVTFAIRKVKDKDSYVILLKNPNLDLIKTLRAA